MREAGFLHREDGGITVLSLFMFIVLLCIGGFAIDVNNAVRARVQLQGATDAAGHAALAWRYRHSAAEAIAKGVEIAEANMPTSIFGEVLATADVEFGTWDSDTRTFTPDSTSASAVRVTGRRNAAGSNGVTTFLLKVIGQPVLNIHTRAVWVREDGWCPGADGKDRGEGFFARGRIDIQSNNDFLDGFCVHSQSWVELQNGNTFENGVTVSMPHSSDVVLPASGFKQNSGLQKALKSHHTNLDQFFDEMPDYVASFHDPADPVQPSYITEAAAVTVNADVVDMTNLTANAVNRVFCSSPKLQIDDVLTDLVLITDCPVQFKNGAALENAVLVVENLGADAVKGSSGLRIGAVDYCATETGGAMILTLGDFSSAANFQAYGSNVVAMGNMSITANADGLAGINFMAGGTIDMTSGGDLGFCNQGPPGDLVTPVFTMVQ